MLKIPLPSLAFALCLGLIPFAGPVSEAEGALLVVTNPGFEDTTGQTTFNEFTFGTPAGWTLYDPDNLVPDPTVFTGTLEPNGVDFFNSTAPEGDKVSILFNSGREGEGEYGYTQTLGDSLQANTTYELDVEVGNIASGTATNGVFFDLDEFPGYRIDLLAGGVVIASDLNSLTIAEGEFDTSSILFSTGAAHAQLGQQLGIRLVNLNEIPAGFTQETSPDLEVDFDNVTLNANANSVPEPSTTILLALTGIGVAFRRRRNRCSSES